MANQALVKKTDVSSFRKIAIGTWQDAYDPSVYGTMDIRMDEAMKYINASFDHRFIDGFHAAVMSRVLRTWLEDPYSYFDNLHDLSAAGAIV